MVVALLLLAGLGAVGWSVAYRASVRCLRYRGVIEAVRGSSHAHRTLVDALMCAHGVES